ncbi:heat shock protein 70kD, putative [Entamoeba dispar SAW760]|uniref:Heat shock protein 70kD, putative n=1 Tax=Entamoeba dispar (strain ATCC PRA-260 / SAW760) TaxID=370354 RepID=B0E7K6_ENTDS|nr:heat shock protein 70kD, putative [Entamoeba dispar SAW760]EDR29476.1 heat shock protein 70kD, putative [Entamoeba dispar SAW760]|eukprot:EDR29476.1 heat shock protein 70kD, putative [Entamoeba dispar SAW760]
MSTLTLAETPIHVGIDLGTTYSSIAIYSENENKNDPIEVLEIANNEFSVPSWVQLFKGNDGTKQYNVSINAKRSGGICLHDSKRLIGETVKHYNEQKNLLPSFTSFVVSTENDEIKMCVEDPLNQSETESFYPIEVSAMVLRTLYNILRQRIGNKKIGKVVVTIPVSFTPRQKKETIQACKMAGFEDISLLHEPTASVIEFDREFHLKEKSKIVVIDCGGGTTDVACCIFNGQEQLDNNKIGKVKEFILNKIKEVLKTQKDFLILLEPEKESDKTRIKSKKKFVSQNIEKITAESLKTLEKGNSMKIGLWDIYPEWEDEITITPQDVNLQIQKPDTKSKIDCVWNESDLNLGGNNFDDSLITVILDKIKSHIGDTDFQRLFKVNSKDTKTVKRMKEKRMKKIRIIAEDIKKSFSGNTNSLPIDLDSISEGLTGQVDVTKDEFEAQCKKDKILEKLERCIKSVVDSANWKVNDINYVLAIGGSCSIPIVRRLICGMFSKDKVVGTSFNSYTSVVKGAACRAHQLSIDCEDSITQVMPYTLGFGLVENKYDVFAPKGKKLPIGFLGVYSNAHENQRIISIPIYKGEGKKTNEEGMELVTTAIITGLPPGLKEGEFNMIYLTRVNTSGLVEVEIVKADNGKFLNKMKAFVNLGFDEDILKKIQQHLERYIKNSE